jgi:hypothetical protein
VSYELLQERPARWLRVDASGVVTGLSEPWTDQVRTSFLGCLAPTTAGRPFATSNGGAESIYAHLFHEARQLRPSRIELWAASPETAAKFELSVTRRDAEVELGLQLLFERARPERAPFYDPSAPRGDDAIRACGFCQRLDGFRWTEPELALVQLRVDPHARFQPRLKPDVCLECELRLRGSLAMRAAS